MKKAIVTIDYQSYTFNSNKEAFAFLEMFQQAKKVDKYRSLGDNYYVVEYEITDVVGLVICDVITEKEFEAKKAALEATTENVEEEL